MDLEVLNHALSFQIGNYRDQSFRKYDFVRWAHEPSLKGSDVVFQEESEYVISFKIRVSNDRLIDFLM